MIFNVNNIIRDVRVCLDENSSSTVLLLEGDEDTLRLNELIRSKIAESVDVVHRDASYYLLEQGHNFGYDSFDEGSEAEEEVSIHWNGQDTCGYVMIPEDFHRLVVFDMSDWERPVYEAMSVLSPEYAKQRSRVKGVRGNAQRPVCVVAVRSVGRVLEFYSCKSQAAYVKQAVYIPLAKIDSEDNIDISRLCYRGVVYMIASEVLMALGDGERAAVMVAAAKNVLQ